MNGYTVIMFFYWTHFQVAQKNTLMANSVYSQQ